MTTPTFPAYDPHQESEGETVTYRATHAELGDGFVQGVPDGVNTRVSSWSLTWGNEDNSIIREIKDFLDDLNGVSPFLWQAPDETSPSAWYCPGGYRSKPTGPDSQNLTCEFKRWFGATS